MSFAVDSNIWIYSLDSKSARYKTARAFLQKMQTSEDQWVITWSIVYEVLRVVTHPALVSDSVSPQLVMEQLLTFIEKSGIRILPETESHRNFLAMIIKSAGGVRGNFWHDCHIAATLLEHGVNTIYTCDSDFRKIALLKTVNPLT
jgi:predicted nucleic acid-binding protein